MKTLLETMNDHMCRIIHEMEYILVLENDIKEINDEQPAKLAELQCKIKKAERKLKYYQDKLDKLRPYTLNEKVTQENIEYAEVMTKFLPAKMELETLLFKLNDLEIWPIKLQELKTKFFNKCVAVFGSTKCVEDLLKLISANNKVKENYIKTHCENDRYNQMRKSKEAKIKFLEDKILQNSDPSLVADLNDDMGELIGELKDLEPSQVKKMQYLKSERDELQKIYKDCLEEAKMFDFLVNHLPSIKKIFAFEPRCLLFW